MMKKIILLGCVVLMLSAAPDVFARTLTESQLRRIGSARSWVAGVEERSQKDIEKDLLATPYPEENLQIFEAIAAAYRDIIAGQNIANPEDRIWLYSKVKLNMAYFQFGGHLINRKDTALNTLIQKTLKTYLSEDLLSHPVLFQVHK